MKIGSLEWSKKRKCFLGLVTAFLVGSIVWVCIGLNNDLCVTKYIITQQFTNSVRIVQLTDLHNSEFGENNKELIEYVASQNPDLILMTGDMLNRDEENTEIVMNLIRNLTEIAPVYFSYGNHEHKWEIAFEKELKKILEEAGAIVLENEYVDVEINGNSIRIGGHYGYYREIDKTGQSEAVKQTILDFANEFENTEQYKILLCHIPTVWLEDNSIDEYPVDLVLTGHYHGGQMKLPFVGGVFAPNANFFPQYTEGIFKGELATCILSTGLGSSTWVPRLYNPPEVVVIDLTTE